MSNRTSNRSACLRPAGLPVPHLYTIGVVRGSSVTGSKVLDLRSRRINIRRGMITLHDTKMAILDVSH